MSQKISKIKINLIIVGIFLWLAPGSSPVLPNKSIKNKSEICILQSYSNHIPNLIAFFFTYQVLLVKMNTPKMW